MVESVQQSSLQQANPYQFAQPQIVQVSSLDSQKYLSDVSWVKEYLLKPMFGGYEYRTDYEDVVIVGSTQHRPVEVKERHPERAIMNDAGIDYVDNSIKPLTSHVTQNSNVSGQVLKNILSTRIKLIGIMLCKDARTRNMYEFDRSRVTDVVSYLMSWKPLMLKAKGGNWIKDMRGSFSTTEVRNINQDAVKQQTNALASVVNTVTSGVGGNG